MEQGGLSGRDGSVGVDLWELLRHTRREHRFQQLGEGLVRKGIGRLTIFDHDVVDSTNLNRQKFYERDLGKNKAVCLAKNLAQEGFCGSLIRGYALSFQDAVELGIDLSGSVAVCGIDNNPGRVAASRYFRRVGMPVIFVAVSETANNGYVFVQEADPESPCFGCMFTDAIDDNTYPCAAAAIKDILKVVAGLTVYAVDSLLMERKRFWNYKDEYLDGSVPGNAWQVEKRKECQLCGGGQEETPGGSRQ
jgi:adenylyltransferase/sulfurtransferase